MTVTEKRLRLLSVFIGLLFTAAIYQKMHNNPRWDWTAPGIGKLPRDVVQDFMHLAYSRGQGGKASKAYFAKDASDNAIGPQDRVNGAPLQHDVRAVIAQGMTVVVVHRIGPARGAPSMDAVDQFEIKNGRIARRYRYVTDFRN